MSGAVMSDAAFAARHAERHAHYTAQAERLGAIFDAGTRQRLADLDRQLAELGVTVNPAHQGTTT